MKQQAASGSDDDSGVQEALRLWVEETTGGRVALWRIIAGGNRCRSWAVDAQLPEGGTRELYLRYQPPRPPSAEPYTVWREAQVYRALKGRAVPAPELIAVHPEHQAILTQRVPGRADYRRLTDAGERATVAREFIAGLVALHALPIAGLALPGYVPGASIADCVRLELDTWAAMYRETGREDPLIEFALKWLYAELPDCAGEPVLVHGDAGPGNFLFDAGHMTALLDWELAHAGDPMEDLAWYSMRCVMEPVPEFRENLREYARLSGRPLALGRIRYHRALVSARVVIIRHRNVTGLPGNSIVSRALNRRLLVAALAEASGIALAATERLEAAATARTALYDGVTNDLRRQIAEVSREPGVVAAAKDAARVLKYLREADRLGPALEARALAGMSALLGRQPAGLAEGEAELVRGVRAGSLDFAALMRYFAEDADRETQLASLASGGLAQRHFPPLEDDRQ